VNLLETVCFFLPAGQRFFAREILLMDRTPACAIGCVKNVWSKKRHQRKRVGSRERSYFTAKAPELTLNTKGARMASCTKDTEKKRGRWSSKIPLIQERLSGPSHSFAGGLMEKTIDEKRELSLT